jgi:hypothetical protein
MPSELSDCLWYKYIARVTSMVWLFTGSLIIVDLLYFIIIKILHLLLHQPLKIQILQLVIDVDKKEIME